MYPPEQISARLREHQAEQELQSLQFQLSMFKCRPKADMLVRTFPKLAERYVFGKFQAPGYLFDPENDTRYRIGLACYEVARKPNREQITAAEHRLASAREARKQACQMPSREKAEVSS